MINFLITSILDFISCSLSNSNVDCISIRIDATGVSFPGINRSNTRPHQHSCRESNVSRKRGMLEHNEGATGLKRLLYDDLCLFISLMVDDVL